MVSREEKRKVRPIWMHWIGALILLLGLSLGVTTASAHGGAELTVSPVVAAPGGTVTVKGEGVEAGETFTITVEGTTFQATLGTVTVGDDEDFHEEFTLPAEIPPGTYQVRAVSEEGEVLTAELTVEAGTAMAEPAAPAEPSTEPMQLDRRRSTGELTVIIAGLLLSAGLGLVLIREKG